MSHSVGLCFGAEGHCVMGGGGKLAHIQDSEKWESIGNFIQTHLHLIENNMLTMMHTPSRSYIHGRLMHAETQKSPQVTTAISSDTERAQGPQIWVGPTQITDVVHCIIFTGLGGKITAKGLTDFTNKLLEQQKRTWATTDKQKREGKEERDREEF